MNEEKLNYLSQFGSSLEVELIAEIHYLRAALDQIVDEHTWKVLELENIKADNSDLERENRRMKWALSSRWSTKEGTYYGATMLDDYKKLTQEFWEGQGL